MSVPHITENPGKIRVHSIYSKSGKVITETDITEALDLPRFDQEAPICTVSIDKSLTKNLGNYSSFKVGAFVSVPTYLEESQIAAAFDFARNQVDNAIKTVLEDEGLASA